MNAYQRIIFTFITLILVFIALLIASSLLFIVSNTNKPPTTQEIAYSYGIDPITIQGIEKLYDIDPITTQRLEKLYDIESKSSSPNFYKLVYFKPEVDVIDRFAFILRKAANQVMNEKKPKLEDFIDTQIPLQMSIYPSKEWMLRYKINKVLLEIEWTNKRYANSSNYDFLLWFTPDLFIFVEIFCFLFLLIFLPALTSSYLIPKARLIISKHKIFFLIIVAFAICCLIFQIFFRYELLPTDKYIKRFDRLTRSIDSYYGGEWHKTLH